MRHAVGRSPAGRVIAPAQLERIFRDLVRWAVASSIGASGACAGHHGGSEQGDGPGNAIAGSGAGGGRWSAICVVDLPPLLSSVQLTGVADYAGIFQTYPGAPWAGRQAGIALLAEKGSSCGTATDEPTCRTAFQAQRVPSQACMSQGTCVPFVLTTLGDEVTRSEERAALLALLGAIDDPREAALVALFDGYYVGCPEDGSPPRSGTETRVAADGYDLRAEWDSCGEGMFRQTLHVGADGSVVDRGKDKFGESNCAIGRRPAGLLSARRLRQQPGLGAFLADAARLEAASVYAFERLARELAALGAPAELIDAAAGSALDEIRHARMVAALARRFGATPEPVEVAPQPARSALAIALENAVEGCVRETFGALIAHHQAHAALDPQVRAVMASIADDETRHARLAWQVAAWLEPRLSDAAQRTIARARAAALAQLARELEVPLDPAGALAIGWPSPAAATRLIARLADAFALTG